MMMVPRRVRKIPDQQNTKVENPPEDLQAFRTQAAWVLLGEPGAGKSAAFEMEAAATNGKYLPINEFIVADLEADWQGKTLFLDGLDETRASGGSDSTLQQLCRQLKRLGNPHFRVACRAADWYGSTDRDDLKRASPNAQFDVLLLEPLTDEDILTILRENYPHDIPDPRLFVQQAEQRGIDGLLDNPQTLGLLTQAIRGDQWPKTRDETFQRACEKLAEEAHKRHRNNNRNPPRDVEKILAAAGQLSAILLFSNKTGIALDLECASERFPTLADCAPPDPEAASQAVGCKLFRPAGEERVEPSHRSIAEYLAAHWLARQIDSQGVPLRRVLNLLLGVDGGVVAGLRGLYGWLALHCRAARPRLIEADPLTVVVYGDVKPMPVADKRLILAGLRREVTRFSAFRWDARTMHVLGALAAPELQHDFKDILQSPERDDVSQAHADCVLDILIHGEVLQGLAPTLLAMVGDDSWWPVVRRAALDSWLKLTTEPHVARALLDEVTAGRMADHEDELAGTLLCYLYPTHLEPKALLGYLHVPKNSRLYGVYSEFWTRGLLRCVPDSHIPILLDGLVDRSEFSSHDPYERRLNRMVDALLAHGITVHGDGIADERLFAWLGIGADEYGSIQREQEHQQVIKNWLGARPARYKALLALCFRHCEQHDDVMYCVNTQAHRLHHATPPQDIGLWHLEQASYDGNDERARIHLGEAVRALMSVHIGAGISLEELETWAAVHPERKHWLETLLVCEIPGWRIERAIDQQTHVQCQAETRRNRRIQLTPFIPAILAGTVRADIMHQLAGVWGDFYNDTPGETPIARFDSFCENGAEMLATAEAGFRRCPERTDLPTVNEVIDLSIEQKEHFVRRPCLIGMELRWQDGVAEIENLCEDILRRMIAFRLTDGTGETPAWFIHLVQQYPVLVAEVLIVYASATLKAGKDFVACIYPLKHEPEYRKVAMLAAPRLLETFPGQARSGQLNHLENLLKAVLRYQPESLKGLAKKKTAMKGMDVAQKIYWHAAATLLDPKNNEAALWRYIGKSQVRANHLSRFLSNSDDTLNIDYTLSAHTLGRLIELIAPHAETEWPNVDDWVTDATERGVHVRALITQLGAMGTDDAEKEIDRLLKLHSLIKLKRPLESARHQHKLRRRENEFRFLEPRGVAQVLANKAPASAADLTALTLDHLDDIAREIRQDNDDGFRAFWNIENKKPTSQRDENLCRDALLTRLRARLSPLGIDCQPEGDYFNDKRADLRLSYRTEFELAIEIKRDTNESLWGALREQLIEQYAIAPRADGHGIYFVLWFGDVKNVLPTDKKVKSMPRATDGDKKPRSPEELRIRLEAQLDPLKRQRIFVRVLDVSWPN